MDELVTWKQLTWDRRLSDALAECDERGVGRAVFGGQRADPALPQHPGQSLHPARCRSDQL
jgi:hypothetical protein